MSTPGSTDQASVEQLLRLGDSALVHGQRLSEWCGHGPALEEDIALTNIALDCVGEARLLLALAGAREGQGRDEDALAYLRDEAAFRNYTLVELPNGNGPHDDYAITVVRGFLHAALQVHLWPALAACADRELAAIAARSINEARAHLRHFGQWVVRLGDGTDLSHARIASALERLFPYTTNSGVATRWKRRLQPPAVVWWWRTSNPHGIRPSTPCWTKPVFPARPTAGSCPPASSGATANT